MRGRRTERQPHRCDRTRAGAAANGGKSEVNRSPIGAPRIDPDTGPGFVVGSGSPDGARRQTNAPDSRLERRHRKNWMAFVARLVHRPTWRQPGSHWRTISSTSRAGLLRPRHRKRSPRDARLVGSTAWLVPRIARAIPFSCSHRLPTREVLGLRWSDIDRETRRGSDPAGHCAAGQSVRHRRGRPHRCSHIEQQSAG